jgi:hypothetical protein
MENKEITLTLPHALFERIQTSATGQGKSLEALILAVLEEKYPAGAEKDSGMSQEEEDKVKERLKALGYMD